MGHAHVEDGHGWYEWDREEIDAAAAANPKAYKGVRVKRVKICGGCGEVMATKIEYEK